MAELGQHCTHPWLRVTCGACGEAVDALGDSAPDAGGGTGGPRRLATRPVLGDDSQAIFIVARGHPELLDQLRAVMGHGSGVEIIEDRRQRPREATSQEEARELRRRLRGEGQGDQA